MCVPKLRFKADDGSEFPEWEERRLGDVCDIVGGGTPDTEKSEYWNEDINWFTPSEIGTTKYAVKSSRQISKLGILKSSAKLLPRGTILLTSRATLGEMAITRQECCTNQGFQSLIIKPGYLNEFIYYCQSVIKKYCKKHASGSTFLEIGKKEISECKLGIPSLPEQRKIAAFLSAIDTHLELLKSELSKWEQFKKGMLQKIFHQEIRFKADDGSEFPEWEEKRLGEEGYFYGGLSGKGKDDFGHGNGRFLTYMNVYKNPFAKQDIVGYVDIRNTEKQNNVQYGDVLFTQSSETIDEVGLSSVYLYDDHPYLNSFCVGFRFNDLRNICPTFIGYCMRSNSVRKNIMLMGQGISRINIGTKRLATIRYELPSLPEQQKIADLFSSIDQMIEHAKQEVEYWESYKKGLLQQMFV